MKWLIEKLIINGIPALLALIAGWLKQIGKDNYKEETKKAIEVIKIDSKSKNRKKKLDAVKKSEDIINK